MNLSSRILLRATLITIVVGLPLFVFAQHRAAGGGNHVYRASEGSGYVGTGNYPDFGGFNFGTISSSPLDVPPRYWWVSPYPSEPPCQAGCNPNAGYEWDSVGTLILDTNPPKARVSLDGLYAGTTDKLGPFQLPVGEHTLHIAAAGYAPTDIVVRFDKPGVQSLNVGLKRIAPPTEP